MNTSSYSFMLKLNERIIISCSCVINWSLLCMSNLFYLLTRAPSLGDYLKYSRNLKRVADPGNVNNC